MLGIVNLSLVSIEAIKQKGKKMQFYLDCKFCGRFHNKGECPAFGKLCNAYSRKNHFEAKCTQKKRKRSDRTNGRKCIHKCNVHEIRECHDDENSVEVLKEQVQSLFYQQIMDKTSYCC